MASPVRAGRRALARVPRPVLAATAAFAALLALWSIALPLGDAPDETAHADLVFHLATGAPYPRYDGRRVGVALSQLCFDTTAAIRACPRKGEVVSPTGIRRHTAANAPDKAGRRTFDRAGGDREIGPFNQMLQHPPLYYTAMSGLLRAERFVLPGTSLPPLDRELALLRLVNVVLIAPLPLLAWWTCRRLGLGHEIGVVASLIPFAVPQLSHIGSTLNNDNLLTLLLAALTVLLAGVARGDVSKRTAIAVGMVTGLALLTKAFALVLPVAVAAAYALAWSRSRNRITPKDPARRDPLIGVAMATVVTAAVGGWWYVRNVLRGDGLSPSTETARLTTRLRPPGFHPQPVHWLGRFVTLFTDRFWGWFGWYTVRISVGVIVAATVVLVSAIAIGCWKIGREPGLVRPTSADEAEPSSAPSAGPADAAIMLLPAGLLGMFVMARSWSLYSRTGQLAFIQGRYLFAAIVGIAVVAAAGLRHVAGRWAAVATLAFAGLMQVEGLRRVLSGYWGARGSGPLDQLRALVAWSAWPGELIAAGGAVFVAMSAWLVFEVARTTRHRIEAVASPVAPEPVTRGAGTDAPVPAAGLHR